MNDLDTRPVAFGYMRVPDPTDHAHLAQLHRQVETYARERGYRLARVLVDTPLAQRSAFVRLVELLQGGEATELVVPTLEHFTKFTSLQVGVIDQLHDLGVTVWEVGD
ncbi:recombinase family protein [Nocardiopsis lambiniae]|uniref:Recombinase family protein n=1 Tax=Nocardiopsis lambiniae TaxID=3075539 RepID=A0ABU2MEA1_9ACTN|nr:recombinase family protein [Nocardiopsis sp. DSM 44743]MDT0330882.1 recombinase family protein [Nocardiopsis sp. DSM 44743]